MKKRNNFSGFTHDNSAPLPKRSVDEICALLKSDEITGYDLKLICNTVSEMYETGRMMQDIRHVPKVTIFGSARTQKDDPNYELCKRFSRKLADLGYMVITGAGPGIMAAGHEGAGAEKSIGVNIDLPFEQSANEFVINSPHLLTYRYFFSRKLTFVREADAVVLFPGGFGTMDEAFEVLTLLQTGRAMPVPFVLLEEEGGTYWQKFMDYVKDGILGNGMINEQDLYLFRRLHTAGDAIDYINNFYRRYHSMRIMEDDRIIIRLNTPVPKGLLNTLEEEYRDFLGDFGIEAHDNALPEEADEPDLAHKPRLVIKADRTMPVDMYLFVRSLNRENIESSTRRQDRPEVQETIAPRPTRVKFYDIFRKKQK